MDRSREALRASITGLARDESGASAIEFALIFPIFFFVLYGSVSYGLLFALNQSLISAVDNGTRAAIAVDPRVSEFETIATDTARAAVAESISWLSPSVRAAVLGASNESVSVSIASEAGLGTTIEIVVEYPNYASNPLIPALDFPVLGSIPPLPDALRARAITRL